MEKRANFKHNNNGRNFVLNFAFTIEVSFFIFVKDKNILSNIDNMSFVFFILTLVLINILFSLSKKISLLLKKLQYIFLIGITSYYIIYTIALIVISSGIDWNIDTFGICMVSLPLDLIVFVFVDNFVQDNKITAVLLILLIIIFSLLFSLSVAIDVHNCFHYNFLYLVCTLSVLLILLILFNIFKKKCKINRWLEKLISNQVIDILISFLFLIFALFFIAAIVLVWMPNLRRLFNEWVPILTLSVSMIYILLAYYKNIKNILVDSFVIYYFIFWAIVPILLFILFLQKNNLGNYTTFKGLLGIILLIDAIVILAFNKDMETLLPKFEKEINLIPKPKAKYIIAKLKLVLSNLTILVTFSNASCSNEGVLNNWINNISNIFYKISMLINKYFKSNNVEIFFSNGLFKDKNFKIILFMFGLVGFLLILSELFFRIEKYIFIKISYYKL